VSSPNAQPTALWLPNTISFDTVLSIKDYHRLNGKNAPISAVIVTRHTIKTSKESSNARSI